MDSLSLSFGGGKSVALVWINFVIILIVVVLLIVTSSYLINLANYNVNNNLGDKKRAEEARNFGIGMLIPSLLGLVLSITFTILIKKNIMK